MIKELTAEKNISSLIEKLEKQHSLDKKGLIMLLSMENPKVSHGFKRTGI